MPKKFAMCLFVLMFKSTETDMQLTLEPHLFWAGMYAKRIPALYECIIQFYWYDMIFAYLNFLGLKFKNELKQ